MAKTKRGTTVQHTAATPLDERVPAGAPYRPIEPDEAETAAVRATDPHRVGIDHTHTKLKAHLSAAQQRAAARKKAAQKRRSAR